MLDIIHMSEIPVLLPVDQNGVIDIRKQNEIVELYSKLESIQNKLSKECEKIDCLIE